MTSTFLTFTLFYLLLVIAPGQDFLMVTKNALIYSRKSAIFTALGISCGFLVHLTYCLLGLAIIISQSVLLFNTIKILGAIYLIYSGVTTMLHPANNSKLLPDGQQTRSHHISDLNAFKQGFLCNVLNPKVTLFFISLSSIIVNPQSKMIVQLGYGAEAFLITFVWFSLVAILVNLKGFKSLLERIQEYFLKTVGFLFVLLGIGLAFLKV